MTRIAARELPSRWCIQLVLALLSTPLALSGCGDGTSTPSTSSTSMDGGSSGGPVTPPPPGAVVINAIAPNTAVAGSADLQLTVTGSNFDLVGHQHSYVTWTVNGQQTLLGYSDTSTTDQLIVLVPAALLSSPLVAQVSVIDYDAMSDSGPPTAGVPPVQFTVTAAPAVSQNRAFAAPVVAGLTRANPGTPRAANQTSLIGGADEAAAIDLHLMTRASIAESSTHVATAPVYLTLDVPGATDTRAFGINNVGQIVGRYDDTGGVTQGFVRSAEGRFRTIAPPGATFTVASDINDSGEIVGRFLDQAGLNHAFILKRGRYFRLDFPGAVETLGRGVDERGDVSGNYVTTAGLERGFVFDQEGFHDIFFPGTDSTDVWDQVPGLEMVGDWSDVEGDVRGYTLRDSKFTIVDFPGSTLTTIRGINHRDMLVGEFFDSMGGDHGFVKMGRAFIQLDAPGAQMTNTNRINDRDTIVGFYQSADGAFHGYVLTGWDGLKRQLESSVMHQPGSHPRFLR
jgi:uncharacterized membrane protein